MGACGSCMFKAGYTVYAETCIGRCLHSVYIHRFKKENGSAAKHSRISYFLFDDLMIKAIPILANNYTYVVADVANEMHVLIDVGDSDSVITDAPTAILTTHKHWDHSHGNRHMRIVNPGIPVYGGVKDHVPNATHKLRDGEVVRIGRLVFKAIWTPGHTKGHMCYLLDGSGFGAPDSLFTGDHLMLAGCGANFEGSPLTMVRSLERLKTLPDATLVWPGHEIGLECLYAAVHLDPNNSRAMTKLAWAISRRSTLLGTCPSTIGEEKLPYLRTYDKAFIETLGVSSQVDSHPHKYLPLNDDQMAVRCFKKILERVCDESQETKEERKKIMMHVVKHYMKFYPVAELRIHKACSRSDTQGCGQRYVELCSP